MQTARQALARIACAAALGFLVASPAMAETRFMKLYQDTATANCANKNTCRAEFKRATDHIKVREVSCNFFATTTNPPLQAHVNGLALGRLTSAGEFTIGQFLDLPIMLIATQNLAQWQVTSSTLHVIPKTWKPAVLVNFSSATNTQMTCTISGDENNP